MSLLSRLYAMQTASPLATLTQPQATPQLGFEWQNPAMLPQTGLAEGAVAMSPKQSAPFDPNAPTHQGGTWGQRLSRAFEQAPNSAMFNMGMGLMAAGSRPGGDMSLFADQMNQFNHDRTQRQTLENEQRRQKMGDARDNQVFARQQQEWGRADERRQRVEGWASGRDEFAQIDPAAAYSAEAEARALANQPLTPAQRAELALQRRGQDMNFAASMASQEMRQRPLSLRGPDRDLMETIRNSSGSANELLGMAQMFREANSRTGTGGGSEWLPFNGLSPDRAAMRQIESMMRVMMRPVGSGATSDYEQRLYAQGVPRADLLGSQNEAVIANIETLARLRNARRYFYEDYADANGTLNGAERAFQQSQEFAQIQAQNPVGQPQRRSGEASAPGGASFDALPPPAQFQEGQRIRDQQSGREFIKRGNQWVPATRGGAATPRAATGARPGAF